MNPAPLYAYMREREAIRLRRAAGQPWPWTDDPILRAYKFTNVFRDQDRTSRFLIVHYYAPHAEDDPGTILFNAAVYRYFGTSEFAAAVGWLPPRSSSLDHIVNVAEDRLSRGERVYTGAYMVTNAGRPGAKHRLICYSFLADLLRRRDTIVGAIQENYSFEEAVRALCHSDGFASFMAKEALLDTTYTSMWPPLTPTDRHTWTAMGPGARRGAGRLKYGELRRLCEREALEVALEAYSFRSDTSMWPREYRDLTLDAIQFCLCEHDKMERVRLGQGRPRSRYHPPPSSIPGISVCQSA
jgi:hypothetical protein